MEPFASPIQIPIVGSSRASRLIDGAHLLIAVTFIMAFPLSVYTVAAVLGVIISGTIQHLSQADLVNRIDAILLRSNDQWSLVTCEGEIVAASLRGSTFVTSSFVILWLKPHEQRLVHIVLTRDNTDPDVFRRLSVRLRVPMT